MNSDGLAGAGSVQEGEERPAPTNGPLHSDWSGALAASRCGESYRTGSDYSSWLAAAAADDELAPTTGHMYVTLLPLFTSSSSSLKKQQQHFS